MQRKVFIWIASSLRFKISTSLFVSFSRSQISYLVLLKTFEIGSKLYFSLNLEGQFCDHAHRINSFRQIWFKIIKRSVFLMGDLQFIVVKVKCASAKFLHQVMLHLYHSTWTCDWLLLRCFIECDVFDFYCLSFSFACCVIISWSSNLATNSFSPRCSKPFHSICVDFNACHSRHCRWAERCCQ